MCDLDWTQHDVDIVIPCLSIRVLIELRRKPESEERTAASTKNQRQRHICLTSHYQPHDRSSTINHAHTALDNDRDRQIYFCAGMTEGSQKQQQQQQRSTSKRSSNSHSLHRYCNPSDLAANCLAPGDHIYVSSTSGGSRHGIYVGMCVLCVSVCLFVCSHIITSQSPVSHQVVHWTTQSASTRINSYAAALFP